jgi:hypothetical protein
MEDAMVCVEGSSLMSPGMKSDRVLHVERPLSSYDDDDDDEHDNKVISGCLFAHSSTDSVFEEGRQWIDVKQGLPPPRQL